MEISMKNFTVNKLPNANREMTFLKHIIAIAIVLFCRFAPVACSEIRTFTDSEGNIFALQPESGKQKGTLLYLDCNGGSIEDIDTSRFVFDSLGWNIAVCGKSKNHRSAIINREDILALVDYLQSLPQVNPLRIVIFGFSGQGAQAIGTALQFPNLFGGIITECAHHGGITNPNWNDAGGLPIILITRETDWNREHNERMADLLTQNGLIVQLIVTEGEHHIGDSSELFEACKLMNKLMSR